LKLGSLEKDKRPSVELVKLFEISRVAFLSANSDPKEYGHKWRKAVEQVRESYDDLDIAGRELKNFIERNLLEHQDVSDPTSPQARELYEDIKLIRYKSDVVIDPFAKRFGEGVLEELLDNPESMVKFVHYAIRDNTHALGKETLQIKDMEEDTLTDGLAGLDLEPDDVALYIIENYGDDKDSKKVKSKVKAAMDMLELIYFSQHSEEDWDELLDIDMKKAEKAQSDFITPNKPMYRIFEINDMNELKGFSGEYIVQEKYDGMRIQLHKIDGNVKIYSYNEKDITEKCKDIVKELKAKHFGECILDAELILFDGKEALHRADTIAHVFKNKYPEATLKAHVFDIMRHDSQMLLEEELDSRIRTLFNNYSQHSSDVLLFPSKKDTRFADSIKEVAEYSKDIMDIPTAEGVMIKDITSIYYVGTKKNPKWVKWKKFVDLDVVVLSKTKTKSGLHSYSVGVGPILDDIPNTVEIDDTRYLNVGKALNTKIAVDVGDIIRVKVDEVKKTANGYSLFSAKVIEVPEVEYPDKLVTLAMLAKDTKKSLNYDVSALEKGIKVTDYVHGETTAILKYDMNGFTLYGFEENNLMSKNALADLDMWKSKAIEIMKTKQGELTAAIHQFLTKKGEQTTRQLHEFLITNHRSLYQDILDAKQNKLRDWAVQREPILEGQNNKIKADPEFKFGADEIKKYETPEKYREGEFKISLREDNNIQFSIRLKDKNLHWTIEIDDEKELFDLFGAAGKYPAEVSENVQNKKTIDYGKIKLGIQRNGYHEYFLEGNKFETKLHIRYLPVEDKKMWLAWTGYKQKPADKAGDEGIWDIYEDKFNSVKIPK
tara:strand:- start:4361 stop:6850 length:2490 start_codon:yes stop_codon:yes gene_type:complete